MSLGANLLSIFVPSYFLTVTIMDKSRKTVLLSFIMDKIGVFIRKLFQQ